MLVGRARERATIETLLARASGGRGGGAVLHGEPGIGKSALLGYAADGATAMRVLRTIGVEPESDLGYATLHRLLLPVLDRRHLLPPPQAHALGVVFGAAEGRTPDRFLVALAALSLLSEVAGERPVLCLVDDAHWADAASLDALSFVARRLDAEPIAMLLAARADEGRRVDGAGLTDVPLAGLDTDAASELLAEHGGDTLRPVERDDLLRTAGGNPLALRELPASADGAGGAEPLPLSTGLQQAFLRRARRGDTDLQRLLLLVAVDGTGRLDVITRAAARLDPALPMSAMETVEDLLVADGSSVTFRHPLIRSAIYHAASDGERRTAHRALAHTLTDPHEADRRAWHLGQAAVAPDEPAATELERSAERASARAGPSAAAAALARAADLSGSDTRRARRLVAAADAWWRGGYPARATALLGEAERLPADDETVDIDVASLRALVELRAGTPADALTLLVPVLPHVLDTDAHRAILLLMLFGEATFQANAATAWADAAELVERMPLTGDDADTVLTRVFRAACRLRVGGPADLEPADLATVETLTDPTALGWAGGMSWGLGDRDLARRLHRRAAQRARALGAAGSLAWVLDYLVSDELTRGRYVTAEAYAEEGHRFAVETAQTNVACRHLGSLALLAALQGREERTRELTDDLLESAGARQLPSVTAAAYRALGLVDLAAGRPVEALEHLWAIRREGGRTHPGLVLSVVPDLVEAAARAQQAELVTEPFARFVTWAEATGAPGPRAAAARGTALLASGEAATAGFHRALELHGQADEPMERARTELLLGEHLRRERRRAAARPYLRAAAETFRRIGATVWADRAAEELRATGETARRRDPSTLTTLTPQELRIATLVGGGATNKEIAAQLFLSPRTVDYHLRKVFQKLGVSSRTELAGLPLPAADA